MHSSFFLWKHFCTKVDYDVEVTAEFTEAELHKMDLSNSDSSWNQILQKYGDFDVQDGTSGVSSDLVEAARTYLACSSNHRKCTKVPLAYRYISLPYHYEFYASALPHRQRRRTRTVCWSLTASSMDKDSLTLTAACMIISPYQTEADHSSPPSLCSP